MVVTRTALHRSRDPSSGRGSVLAHEGVTQRRGQEGSAVLTRCCHDDPSLSMVVVKLLARNHPIMLFFKGLRSRVEMTRDARSADTL